MRKSTDLWIKDEVRARFFRGTLSRRARPAAGAVGGAQLLRISSPYVPRFQQARRACPLASGRSMNAKCERTSVDPAQSSPDRFRRVPPIRAVGAALRVHAQSANRPYTREFRAILRKVRSTQPCAHDARNPLPSTLSPQDSEELYGVQAQNECFCGAQESNTSLATRAAV